MHPLLPQVVLVTLGAADADVLVVDRDDVRVARSCTVRVSAPVIADAAGDGVVQIVADGVTVDFAGQSLRGAREQDSPDSFTGTGIRVAARGVTLRGAAVSGYRVGILAEEAAGLLVEDCDVSGNFRQRLRSTPQAEDGADWLWPHDNDAGQWIEHYGAGLCVERSEGVTVRRVGCRRGQNGIVLDRVNGSMVYDNNCSFLSGWGLAMWRSSDNLVSRNAFDFCVRGYSHGVYNRGQDSAGILMFEQCCRNVIAENSATHCGDGLFGFAGREALGEAGPRQDPTWHLRRGNNDNRIVGNDFSYAAAHGIEMTFSFGNEIMGNRLAGNAICGVWAGYSARTLIAGNLIEDNGAMGYGPERGGVNIEHGRENRIVSNTFRGNRCGVYLWWDEDPDLAGTPWAAANGAACSGNRIEHNSFRDDQLAMQIRNCDGTIAVFDGPQPTLDLDERSRRTFRGESPGPGPEPAPPPAPASAAEAVGDTRPVGARPDLHGRERIIMTEWAPYDWREPLLHRVEARADAHAYEIVGAAAGAPPPQVRVEGEVSMTRHGGRIVLEPRTRNAVVPYGLMVHTGDATLRNRSALAAIDWTVRAFSWETDPRTDLAAWHAEAERHGVEARRGDLDLRFGGGGPADLGPQEFRGAGIGSDRFGTIADAQVTFPAGSWRIATVSDDGIRVRLGENLAIDDWTWHPPREHAATIHLERGRTLPIHVEHFELDGYAVLSLRIEPAGPVE